MVAKELKSQEYRAVKYLQENESEDMEVLLQEVLIME